MKITYRKLLESIQAFRELNETEFMPRTALDLAKLSKQIDNEIVTFNEIREKISEKYKDKPEDLEEAQKQQEKSNEEFNELIESEVELTVKKIPFSVIERTNKNFKPSTMISLDWLLDTPEEEPPTQSEPITPEIAGKEGIIH